MSKKVLIVEEESSVGEALMSRLRAEGYDAVLSRSGDDGWKKMQEFAPDIVVLDTALPLLNGCEFLEKKLRAPSLASIPLIIISDLEDTAEIRRAFFLGAKGVIEKKPFNAGAALAAIRRELEKTESIMPNKQKAGTDKKLFSGEKILMVEDDATLSAIMSHQFAAEGAVFVGAFDGDEAFNFLKTNKPDIILLDILLPMMNGFEILERIKKDSVLRLIPVILLSNFDQKKDIERGRELGAARFIVKISMSPREIAEETCRVIRETKNKLYPAQ
jgi:two-component system phosphate regulon response regulator PhoB/two-component system alkaline phosphatase synthesis response regulator PhoP